LGDLRGIHVLAIDDEEDALTLLRLVLETAGAGVTTLNAPLTARASNAGLQSDLLVVDLEMPKIDGFELICRVRKSADATVRRIPAAALTAFA
jgi:CheY-like chemotaxis protein